jgi:hypothetical protein
LEPIFKSAVQFLQEYDERVAKARTEHCIVIVQPIASDVAREKLA